MCASAWTGRSGRGEPAPPGTQAATANGNLRPGIHGISGRFLQVAFFPGSGYTVVMETLQKGGTYNERKENPVSGAGRADGGLPADRIRLRGRIFRHGGPLGPGRRGVSGRPGGGQGHQRHHLCPRPEDDRLRGPAVLLPGRRRQRGGQGRHRRRLGGRAGGAPPGQPLLLGRGGDGRVPGDRHPLRDRAAGPERGRRPAQDHQPGEPGHVSGAGHAAGRHGEKPEHLPHGLRGHQLHLRRPAALCLPAGYIRHRPGQ